MYIKCYIKLNLICKDIEMPDTFENIEIRKAANGFILIVSDEDNDAREYVYDTSRKLMRMLKPMLEGRRSALESA